MGHGPGFVSCARGIENFRLTVGRGTNPWVYQGVGDLEPGQMDEAPMGRVSLRFGALRNRLDQRCYGGGIPDCGQGTEGCQPNCWMGMVDPLTHQWRQPRLRIVRQVGRHGSLWNRG